jgi:hypothetical protein
MGMMGQDLTFYIDRYKTLEAPPQAIGHIFLHTGLQLDRDYSLFSMFGGRGENKQVVYPQKIKSNISIFQYFDDGCRKDNTDPYGQILTYCYAGDFRKIKKSLLWSDYNKLVVGFIVKLPKDQPIILYWH